MDMPAAFHIDVTGLEDFSMSIRIGDIEVADGVAIIRDPQEMIARVVAPRIEEEAAEEAEDLLEGEEVEEGAEEAGDAEGGADEDRPSDRRQR